MVWGRPGARLVQLRASQRQLDCLLRIEKKIATAKKVSIHPYSHYAMNKNLLNTYCLPELGAGGPVLNLL